MKSDCSRCKQPIKGHVYQWRGQNLHKECLRIIFEYAQKLKRKELDGQQIKLLGQLRAEAHRVMDRHWKIGGKHRQSVYDELQRLLGCSEADAHISRCNEAQLRIVIEHFGSVKLEAKKKSLRPKIGRPARHSVQYRMKKNAIRESQLMEES